MGSGLRWYHIAVLAIIGWCLLITGGLVSSTQDRLTTPSHSHSRRPLAKEETQSSSSSQSESHFNPLNWLVDTAPLPSSSSHQNSRQDSVTGVVSRFVQRFLSASTTQQKEQLELQRHQEQLKQEQTHSEFKLLVQQLDQQNKKDNENVIRQSTMNRDVLHKTNSGKGEQHEIRQSTMNRDVLRKNADSASRHRPRHHKSPHFRRILPEDVPEEPQGQVTEGNEQDGEGDSDSEMVMPRPRRVDDATRGGIVEEEDGTDMIPQGKEVDTWDRNDKLIFGNDDSGGQSTGSAWASASLSNWTPVPGNVTFYVIGDWGWPPGDTTPDNGNQRAVANALGLASTRTHPSFVLSVGDNFYDEGVTSTSDIRFQNRFELTYNARALNVPWYVTLGNHDCLGDAAVEVAYSSMSTKWTMPARYYYQVNTVPGTGKAPAFNVHTIGLDTCSLMCDVSNQVDDADCNHPAVLTRRAAQLSWLAITLQRIDSHRQPGDWLLVFGHHSPFSTGPHGNNVQLHHDLLPLLQAHHVNAYFAGHDHSLQHLSQNVTAVVPLVDLTTALAHMPFDATTTQFHSSLYDGFHIIISGAGGADLNSEVDAARVQVGSPFAGGPVTVHTSLLQYGVAQVTLTSKSMVVEFINTNANTIYRALIVKK